MASPSPSDLCWVLGFTPHGHWIAPVLRAAVRLEFSSARRIAATHLGDESLAPEIMEMAIQRTAEHLADLPQIGVEDVCAILNRHYRNEIRRRRRSAKKLLFIGTGSEIEILQPSSYFSLSAIEAKLDLDKLLQDTPADVRAAMLLRYCARGRWNEVGQVVARSSEAVRKSCQRRISLIRERLSVEDAATQNQRTDGSPRREPRGESSPLGERRRE